MSWCHCSYHCCFLLLSCCFLVCLMIPMVHGVDVLGEEYGIAFESPVMEINIVSLGKVCQLHAQSRSDSFSDRTSCVSPCLLPWCWVSLKRTTGEWVVGGLQGYSSHFSWSWLCSDKGQLLSSAHRAQPHKPLLTKPCHINPIDIQSAWSKILIYWNTSEFSVEIQNYCNFLFMHPTCVKLKTKQHTKSIKQTKQKPLLRIVLSRSSTDR